MADIGQAPFVQKVDSAIHRINPYPPDKSLSTGIFIHWIVIYPVDSAIHRINPYPPVYLSTG